jgi:hypothetical protein
MRARAAEGAMHTAFLTDSLTDCGTSRPRNVAHLHRKTAADEHDGLFEGASQTRGFHFVETRSPDLHDFVSRDPETPPEKSVMFVSRDERTVFPGLHTRRGTPNPSGSPSGEGCGALRAGVLADPTPLRAGGRGSAACPLRRRLREHAGPVGATGIGRDEAATRERYRT